MLLHTLGWVAEIPPMYISTRVKVFCPRMHLHVVSHADVAMAPQVSYYTLKKQLEY